MRYRSLSNHTLVLLIIGLFQVNCFPILTLDIRSEYSARKEWLELNESIDIDGCIIIIDKRMIITNYSMFQCILINIRDCLLSIENSIFGFSVRDFSTNSVSLTRSKQGFTLNNRYDYIAPRNYAIILSRFQIHESLKLVPITIEYFLLGSRTITFFFYAFFTNSLLERILSLVHGDQ